MPKMETVRLILARLTVCCVAYALIEAVLPSEGRRCGSLEGAAKAAAIALTAAVLGI